MITIGEVVKHLDSFAPPAYQEDYDNSGLLTGDAGKTVTSVLVTLDCTEDVVDEAISSGANMIIAHHPIIFRGLKKLTGKNYVERTVIKAIKNDIAIFAIHTNLDNVFAGVNRKIAEKIGLKNLKILVPKNENQQVGSGMIGELDSVEEPIEFLERLKSGMNTKCVRHTPIVRPGVKTVALCGGSGSFLLQAAIRAGADVFVSADFKYHEFFDADGKIIIADIGHYESEQFTKELISEVLREKFRTFAINFSKTVTNPIRYL